jgi:hypothetical protein
VLHIANDIACKMLLLFRDTNLYFAGFGHVMVTVLPDEVLQEVGATASCLTI